MYDPNDVLLIDTGNTRTSWQYGSVCGEILNESILGSPKQYEAEFPQSVRVASVSVAGAAVRTALRKHLQFAEWIDVDRVDSSVFPTEYAEQELGTDRWLASLAAFRKSGSQDSQVVVDAGTAVTVDLVEDGRHKGGWILPGLRMWQRTLLGQTEIPAWQEADPALIPGLATRHAIASGWLASVSGAIRQLQSGGRNGNVWLTGGDRDRLAPAFPEARLERNLVLDGLNYWLQAKGVQE